MIELGLRGATGSGPAKSILWHVWYNRVLERLYLPVQCMLAPLLISPVMAPYFAFSRH
jgi:hypothetical protein